MKRYAQLTKTNWISISGSVFENGGRSGTSAIAFMELDDETGIVRILEGIDTPDEIRDLFENAEIQDDSIDENFDMNMRSYAQKEMQAAISDKETHLHEVSIALNKITGKAARKQSYRDREKTKGRKGRLFHLTDEENAEIRTRIAELRA